MPGPTACNGDSKTHGSLQGTVYAPDGERTVQTTVTVGEQQTACDTSGRYRFDALPPGSVTVRSEAFRWLAGAESQATVIAGQEAVADLHMSPKPLKLMPEDALIAQAYRADFDWTQAVLSISVLPRPTRSELQKALYSRNPALYDDWTDVPTLTPSPVPSLGADGATGLTFPVPGQADQIPCSFAGDEAIDLATVADSLPAAISQAEQRDALLWEPMQVTLMQWDASAAADLYCVGAAIRRQRWGSTQADLPFGQSIEEVYLHDSGGELEVWVKVAFASFVELGSGITDSDGDSRLEIFARADGRMMNTAVREYLLGDYSTAALDAYALGTHLADLVDRFYGVTNPRIDSYTGTSVTVPGHGTLAHPFAVVTHSGSGIQNVLLAGP
jgi:hypothetical protein